jgi:hypothetical protein
MPSEGAVRSQSSVSSLDAAGASSPPASVNHPLQRVSRVEQSAGQLAVAIEPEILSAVFGIDDPNLAMRLLSQLVGFVQPDPGKPVEAGLIDQMLTLIEGINPSGMLEAMTATMLVGTQHVALDSLRRASHPDQSPAGRAMYQSLAFKAMRAFAQLLETLHQGRGRGVTQQIIVKHVTVEAGAQAVVGAVATSTGGGGVEKSEDQSYGARSGGAKQRNST